MKIAIIGANAQQNPLILQAKERGYETHTFAWHDGVDVGRQSSDYFYPISATNREGILSKCREIGIEAVASIGSDMSAQAAAYVCEHMGLRGNGIHAVLTATNKLLTRKSFARVGISQPAYVEIGDAVPFEAIECLHYPLIVKPSDRSGSRGIRIIESERDFFGAINEARDLSFERKAIVEELIDGSLYSCECVSAASVHQIVGYTKRETAFIGGRPCEYKHTQPATLPRSVFEKLKTELPRALDALGITDGVSSAEFIIDCKNNIYFLEISPYMYGDYVGSDLVPLAYGVNLTGVVLDIAVGTEIALSPEESGMIASVEFDYSPIDGTRGEARISSFAVKEFGGYPALHLPLGRPYYENGGHTVALNSEYAAVRYALECLNPRRLHLPHYCAPYVPKIAAELEIECVRYAIGSDFLPIDLTAIEENDAVFLVNYHGLCADEIARMPFFRKIIDNSMAFYQAPILEEGTYNVYSCRKFFAVSDGAYLVSESLCDGKRKALVRDLSYKRATALLKSLELGESAAYKEGQTNEQELSKKYCLMSALTERMMASVDYDAEREARAANYALLHERLRAYNQLDVREMPSAAPQYYPFLASEDIRSFLLAKRVFVPLMWRNTLGTSFEGTPEKTFSEKLICLPVSSEYSQKDMEYLAELVISLVN